MTVNRRDFLASCAAAFTTATVGATISATANAQPRPGSVVKIVVPFSTGGPTDFIARHFAALFAEELGTTVIVDNRPGASGNIGTQLVIDSPADGLTLVHTTAGMQAVNPLMYPTARFHPNQDLVPVGITGALPNVLVVHPDSGIRSLAALIEKGKRSDLTYATFGPGSSPHVYGATLQRATGIKATPIPYKGSGSAIIDMLAGQIDFMFDSLTTSVGHVRAGKLTGLAVTSRTRSEVLPEIPTLGELGIPAADLDFWFALQVKAGTAKEDVEALRGAVARVTRNPRYIDGMKARGVQSLPVAPDQLERFVKTEYDKWTAAAKAIDLKAE